MKKSILFALIGLSLMFGSCKTECEKNLTGNLTVNSVLSDPYEIWIDGTYEGSVSPYSNTIVPDLKSGIHSVYCEQESGYIISPISYTATVDISICQTFDLILE